MKPGTRVQITFTPNKWHRTYGVPGLIAAPISGEVLHIGSTVIETGSEGGQFFAVPCLVVDTGFSIEEVPLRQHDRNVHVAKLLDSEVRPSGRMNAEGRPVSAT